MEIKGFVNAEAPQGKETMFNRSWLKEEIESAGFVNTTFKAREMPVYVKDEDGNYVKDSKGNRKVGYYSIKVEYSWTDPDTGAILESTNRVNPETGETGVDCSLWAYNVLSKAERERIMNAGGITNVVIRRGFYQDGDNLRVRCTFDALKLADGTVFTAVGAKRGYREYDANPEA